MLITAYWDSLHNKQNKKKTTNSFATKISVACEIRGTIVLKTIALLYLPFCKIHNFTTENRFCLHKFVPHEYVVVRTEGF